MKYNTYVSFMFLV